MEAIVETNNQRNTSDRPMTVLARYHIQYPGTTPWVDVTGRVIGDAKWSEGRNLTLLGGPLPPAVPATLNCTLDNFDGFFTKGAGSALGPGARFRLQWRATTGDAWATRYLGRLSERRVRFQGSSRIAVRWYGALVHLTGSNIPGRIYGNRAPEVIMGQICDAANVPTDEREFDTDAVNRYSVQTVRRGTAEWSGLPTLPAPSFTTPRTARSGLNCPRPARPKR